MIHTGLLEDQNEGGAPTRGHVRPMNKARFLLHLTSNSEVKMATVDDICITQMAAMCREPALIG